MGDLEREKLLVGDKVGVVGIGMDVGVGVGKDGIGDSDPEETSKE